MLHDYQFVIIILIVLILVLGFFWNPIQRAWKRMAMSFKSARSVKTSKSSILKVLDEKNLLQTITTLLVRQLLYTRLAMEAIFNTDSELDTIVLRLMKNQQDIGHTFGAIYGSESGTTIMS